ncbi:hypothetical protein ACGFX4_39565 [Kitasatospora sp. NPDC048365]|uniref:hypothetical protein n=1 Tax=Kitasatospora sp. NPDC048365 TaxID=3364050 RepID=UPI003712FE33
MSSDKLFVIVEGKDLDGRFYDQICSHSPSVSAAGYQVWLSEQIKDDVTGVGSAGKKAVLAHYEYFRSKRKLSVTTSSGKHSIAFMVDRDNEDYSGGRRRSPHVIYTQMFDAEAEAFFHGNDDVALANIFSLDMQSAKALAKDISGWVQDLADLWQDWIILCCLANKVGSRCDVGYGHESSINSPRYGPVDAALVADAEQRIGARSRCGSQACQVELAALRAKMLRAFARADRQKLVKGKWLSNYLAHRAKEYFGTSPVLVKGAEVMAARAYLAACDFSEPWTRPYASRLEALL